jgi:hypothetical protein
MNYVIFWTLGSYHDRNLPELPIGYPPTMKVSFFPMKRFCVHFLVLTATLNFAVTAYAQQDTQQVEDRVNGILLVRQGFLEIVSRLGPPITVGQARCKT